MAEGKKSFVLYSDQKGIFDKLTDDQAGRLIKHIYSYVNDEYPEGDFVTELAFESIKSQLKRDLKKYDEIKKKRSEAGKKGGRPKQSKAKKPNALFDKQSKAKKAVNDNVNDNVNVNVTSIYIPPFDEFRTYALEKAPGTNEEKLKLKYEAWKENNWKDGHDKKIKNWKSKLLQTIQYLQNEKDQRNDSRKGALHTGGKKDFTGQGVNA